MKKRGAIFIISFICVCLFTCGFGYELKKQQKDIPENPMEGICAQSSFVAYLGKGFEMNNALSGDSAREDDKPAFQTEIIEEKPEEQEEPDEQQEEPETDTEESLPEDRFLPEESGQPEQENTIGDGEEHRQEESDGTDFTSGEEPETITYDETPDMDMPDRIDDPEENNDPEAELPDEDPFQPSDDPEENLYPVIASDLMDGEVVNGSYRTFYVQATDCNGQYLSSQFIEVLGNGNRIYAASDTGQMASYRLDLLSGENLISIKAADTQGRTTTVVYTIHRGEEQPSPVGTITFSLEATTVGLGYLIAPSQIDYYEGEQLSYVMDRAIQENGYTYRYDGSLGGGFYLKHIIRGNLTQGFYIPDDLFAHLEAVNCPMTDYHVDSLGEFDFTQNSGWMYFVNGEYMNSGISTYFPADGDVVRVRFSLYAGADLGCNVNGEAWGDW